MQSCTERDYRDFASGAGEAAESLITISTCNMKYGRCNGTVYLYLGHAGASTGAAMLAIT